MSSMAWGQTKNCLQDVVSRNYVTKTTDATVLSTLIIIITITITIIIIIIIIIIYMEKFIHIDWPK